MLFRIPCGAPVGRGGSSADLRKTSSQTAQGPSRSGQSEVALPAGPKWRWPEPRSFGQLGQGCFGEAQRRAAHTQSSVGFPGAEVASLRLPMRNKGQESRRGTTRGRHGAFRAVWRRADRARRTRRSWQLRRPPRKPALRSGRRPSYAGSPPTLVNCERL